MPEDIDENRDNAIVPQPENKSVESVGPNPDERSVVPIGKKPNQIVVPVHTESSLSESITAPTAQPDTIVKQPESSKSDIKIKNTPIEAARDRLRRQVFYEIPPQINVTNESQTHRERKKKETENLLNIPVVDLSLPLVLAPLLDISLPMDGTVNQARLLLVERMVNGDFSRKVETFYDLVDRLRSLHQAFGDDVIPQMLSLETLAAKQESQLYTSITNLLKNKTFDNESDQILRHAVKVFTDFMDEIFSQKDMYERTPSLLPWFYQRTLDSKIRPTEAMGFIYAHIGKAAVDEEGMKTYKKTVEESQDFPIVQRLSALLSPISLSGRYKGNTTILPPESTLIVDPDIKSIHLRNWLMAFPPPSLLQYVLNQQRAVFNLFGIKEIPDVRTLNDSSNIRTLLSPDNEWTHYDSIQNMYTAFLQKTENLAQFYTRTIYVYITRYFEEQLAISENIEPITWSKIIDYIKVKGVDIASFSVYSSKLDRIKPVLTNQELSNLPDRSIVISLSELLKKLVSTEMHLAFVSDSNNYQYINMLQTIYPNFTPETMDQIQLLSRVFIKNLQKAGVLESKRKKDKYIFAPGYSDYATLDTIVNFLDGTDNDLFTRQLLKFVLDHMSIGIEQTTLVQRIRKKYNTNPDTPEARGQIIWLLQASMTDLYKPMIVIHPDGKMKHLFLADSTNLSPRENEPAHNLFIALEQSIQVDKLMKVYTDYMNMRQQWLSQVSAHREQRETDAQKIRRYEREILLDDQTLASFQAEDNKVELALATYLAKNLKYFTEPGSPLYIEMMVLFTENPRGFVGVLKQHDFTKYLVLLNRWNQEKDDTGQGEYYNLKLKIHDVTTNRDTVANKREDLLLELKDKTTHELSEPIPPVHIIINELIRPLVSTVTLSVLTIPVYKEIPLDSTNPRGPKTTIREKAFIELTDLLKQLDQVVAEGNPTWDKVDVVLDKVKIVIEKFEKELMTTGDDSAGNSVSNRFLLSAGTLPEPGSVEVLTNIDVVQTTADDTIPFSSVNEPILWKKMRGSLKNFASALTGDWVSKEQLENMLQVLEDMSRSSKIDLTVEKNVFRRLIQKLFSFMPSKKDKVKQNVDEMIILLKQKIIEFEYKSR